MIAEISRVLKARNCSKNQINHSLVDHVIVSFLDRSINTRVLPFDVNAAVSDTGLSLSDY
jgi:hypothetical protein